MDEVRTNQLQRVSEEILWRRVGYAGSTSLRCSMLLKKLSTVAADDVPVMAAGYRSAVGWRGRSRFRKALERAEETLGRLDAETLDVISTTQDAIDRAMRALDPADSEEGRRVRQALRAAVLGVATEEALGLECSQVLRAPWEACLEARAFGFAKRRPA